MRAWAGFLAALALCAGAQAGTSVYLAHGRDAALFDQYDIDGFSVEALPDRDGLRIVVRSSPRLPDSRAPYPPEGRARDLSLPRAPDRDALAASLVAGSSLEEQAARAILGWVAREIRYDPDRTRRQDPSAVFSSRRAYCVGFAELAVDLLRRAAIPAGTVQGILTGDPAAPGYSPALSGVYHRWVGIFYPDRGWRFADPLAGRAAVDSRYVPFARRAWSRPEDLRLSVLNDAQGRSR
jgi:transglutaminase-like putative cysteine protease